MPPHLSRATYALAARAGRRRRRFGTRPGPEVPTGDGRVGAWDVRVDPDVIAEQLTGRTLAGIDATTGRLEGPEVPGRCGGLRYGAVNSVGARLHRDRCRASCGVAGAWRRWESSGAQAGVRPATNAAAASRDAAPFHGEEGGPQPTPPLHRFPDASSPTRWQQAHGALAGCAKLSGRAG